MVLIGPYSCSKQKMITFKATPKINFSLILRSRVRYVLFKALIYSIVLAIVSFAVRFAAGFANVPVPVIFIIIFPFVYFGLLLQQSYKEYRLSKILTRSYAKLLNKGFRTESMFKF